MSISLPNGTLLATPAQQTVYTAAVTRILHLSNFPAELKTRDLQVMFKDYENEKGGFRIKWVDDTNALVVFADAGVAKRAYLSHLLSPPPSFPPPAKIAPYTKPDAAQIIQSLAARAMGHRSSMSNYSQQVPLGALPVNVNVNAGGAALAGLDGLPNGINGTSLPGQGQGVGLGQGQHIRAGSMNKGLGGAGWTFPSAATNRANSSSNGGGGGGGSMGPPPLPSLAGSGPSGTGTGTGIGGRHGRTGSASFSRSAMGSIGGGGGGGSGALSFGTGAGGGAGTGAGPSTGIGGLPTHAESLDSPAIPAGFSTTRLEGVGGGSSRRLTGRYTGAGGGAGAGIGGGAFSFGGGGNSSTNNRAAGTNANTTTATGTGIAERPDSRRSVRSVRSGDSSDTEPIVVVQEPRTNSTSTGSTIDGRGKVPFGQWKMPSSASGSGSNSASPTPTGSGYGPAHGHGASPAPDGVGSGMAGAGARRDSVSADKALREVEKALRGVEAQ